MKNSFGLRIFDSMNMLAHDKPREGQTDYQFATVFA